MKDGVLGIVFNATRTEVLLIQRRDVPVWVLPGGGIDLGETPEQAIVREVAEETGLQVVVQRKAAEYSPINRFTAITHLFECTPVNGEVGLGIETRNIGYFPIDSLPKGLFLYHREWLEHALEKPQQLVQAKMSAQTFRSILIYYALRPSYAIRYFLSRQGFPINR